jgi:hypothetical protein
MGGTPAASERGAAHERAHAQRSQGHEAMLIIV